jgi:ring-1,2-phenylacetyl-CoA epoxidase subunit PaaE
MAAPAPAPAASRRARRPVFHPLRVAAVERLCPDAVALTFDVPAELADAYAFAPGQTLTLRRTIDGRDERRSYSICAPAGAPPRIGVREVAGGLFSAWLVHEVRPGDVLDVMTPTGAFTPDLRTPAHHVLVAAGSGITPMVSIAASVLADPRSRVTLLYGNRRSDTVMFADELADLKDLHPERFRIVHVLSREPREAELLSGRLDRERLAALVRSPLVDARGAEHWWLCGPQGMIQDARQVLAGLGVPVERVHHELFYAEDEPVRAPVRQEAVPAGPVSRVSAVLDGRTTSAELPRDRSVLEGLQRMRADVPFACKGGVCGTCRARVTAGRAEMRRNFALEPDEVAAGYVLTCQSYPASEELTVDFDS